MESKSHIALECDRSHLMIDRSCLIENPSIEMWQSTPRLGVLLKEWEVERRVFNSSECHTTTTVRLLISHLERIAFNKIRVLHVEGDLSWVFVTCCASLKQIKGVWIVCTNKYAFTIMVSMNLNVQACGVAHVKSLRNFSKKEPVTRLSALSFQLNVFCECDYT